MIVNQFFINSNYKYRVIFSVLFLSVYGCSTVPEPPDFSNDWNSVNGYTEEIVPIQMYHPYEYKALEIDRTLKVLLARWAKDTFYTSSYNFCFNYTLPKEVRNIKEGNLSQAIEKLSEIYQDYPIKIYLYGSVISVDYDPSKDKNNLIQECG